jgi:hypothetical protein
VVVACAAGDGVGRGASAYKEAESEREGEGIYTAAPCRAEIKPRIRCALTSSHTVVVRRRDGEWGCPGARCGSSLLESECLRVG